MCEAAQALGQQALVLVRRRGGASEWVVGRLVFDAESLLYYESPSSPRPRQVWPLWAAKKVSEVNYDDSTGGLVYKLTVDWCTGAGKKTPPRRRRSSCKLVAAGVPWLNNNATKVFSSLGAVGRQMDDFSPRVWQAVLFGGLAKVITSCLLSSSICTAWLLILLAAAFAVGSLATQTLRLSSAESDSRLVLGFSRAAEAERFRQALTRPREEAVGGGGHHIRVTKQEEEDNGESDSDDDDVSAVESSTHSARIRVAACAADVLEQLGTTTIAVSARNLPRWLTSGTEAASLELSAVVIPEENFTTTTGGGGERYLVRLTPPPASDASSEEQLALRGSVRLHQEEGWSTVVDLNVKVVVNGQRSWSPAELDDVASRAARSVLISLAERSEACRFFPGCAESEGLCLDEQSAKEEEPEVVVKKQQKKKKYAAALRSCCRTMPEKFWAAPVSPRTFNVRGPNYLHDRKKIKGPIESAFELCALDVFWHPPKKQGKRHGFHLAGESWNRVQLAARKVANDDEAHFTFVIVLVIPGPPAYSFAMYFAANDAATLFDAETAFGRVAHDFFKRDVLSEKKNDERFKLIPRLPEANWAVRHAVGSTPALIGKKLKMHYHRGANYMELDVDMGSNAVAANIICLCSRFTKTIVAELAFVLESKTPKELPESILGTIQIRNVDLNQGIPLPTSDSEEPPALDSASEDNDSPPLEQNLFPFSPPSPRDNAPTIPT